MKRSLLIKLHLYCGLFTLFYLIAFGFSTIILNHDIKLAKSEISYSWEATIPFEPEQSDKELSEAVKNKLGLMGWTPFWLYKRNNQDFRFTVSHPGRNYHVTLDLTNGKVLVDEAPMGFLAVLNGLHFFNGNIPNAPLFLRTWAIYQWLALLAMLVSIFFGLWIWIKYSLQNWEGLVFGTLFGLTLLIMMLI